MNFYAPSGPQNGKNREQFLRHDIAAFTLKNIDELLLLGDFNCVISKKYTMAREHNICGALVELLYGLELVNVSKELKKITALQG